MGREFLRGLKFDFDGALARGLRSGEEAADWRSGKQWSITAVLRPYTSLLFRGVLLKGEKAAGSGSHGLIPISFSLSHYFIRIIFLNVL